MAAFAGGTGTYYIDHKPGERVISSEEIIELVNAGVNVVLRSIDGNDVTLIPLVILTNIEEEPVAVFSAVCVTPMGEAGGVVYSIVDKFGHVMVDVKAFPLEPFNEE